MRKAVAGELAVADRDLLEALGAPDVAVHADRAEIERRHAEGLRTHLAVPAIEAAEVEVGVAIGKAAGLDRMGVINQEEEDIAIGSIEGGRILGHLDERVVRPGRPVEQTRHLPSRIARALAGDLHYPSAHIMVHDAAIVRASGGPQFRSEESG